MDEETIYFLEEGKKGEKRGRGREKKNDAINETS